MTYLTICDAQIATKSNSNDGAVPYEKGFAVTLIAGIAASLFTSIFVVRTFYMIWLNRSRGAQTLSI